MERAFVRTRVVQPHEIDRLGHVNNIVWLQRVVDVSVAHCESVGLDYDAQRSLGGVWVVRRHEIDYLRSAHAGDEVVEETWVSASRGAQSIRRCRFTRGGEELVRSVSQWVWVDAGNLRPRRIPEAIAQRLPVVGIDLPGSSPGSGG